ncbi:hypothetical protein EVS84_09145 [Pseudomonas koreensis]|uniref:Glycosyl transferase n=2 Tax=Pseudomonas TaxID=286 RepID=A0A4Q4L5R1_9PSED|nr:MULTISPECIES: hypothetical protein [Pseudomonas]WKV84455.1 hypothetical protein LJJ44_26520 [Pseudomonas sp. B24_DOA]WKV90012.1 hypothetical protein LJU32_06980 [Pseudomonas sp. B21_DOA]KIF65622.1 hypothetical protein NX10_01805 [Pseudomonas fluorescens]MDM8192343.1 hypothetical protein [Pseudomonas fluorescens]MDP8573588.1 hypothetical protein [Pseudomonas iranensis]
MVKIAVAFFGIPRNSPICFPSIEQNVLAQLPAGSEVECFYHLYKVDEVQNSRSGEKGELAADNYQPFESMTGALTSTEGVLERWDFEQVKAQGDTWADDYASLRNLIYQLNSLHTVTTEIESFNPDFVVFVRPDNFFHTPLPGYLFNHAEARRHNVYIPDWQWWGGLNDRFAVCGRDTYIAYGKRIERIFDFCKATGRKLHSERLLKYALLEAGAKVCTLPIQASRVRITGAFAEESFSPKRGMGKRENRYFHFFAKLRTWWDRRR